MTVSNMLSQEEIDALLKGTADDSEDVQEMSVEDYLSLMEKDALGEIGNISFGSSATALSTLLSQKVDITTPEVTIIKREDLKDEFPHPHVAIQVRYTEGFTGMNLLVIKQSDAAIIADLMLGGTGENPGEMMDEIQLSAVQEAMNQMMGSAATSMSTVFNKRVDISPPVVDIIDFAVGSGTETLPNQELLVKISFRLRIGTLIDSSIMQVIPLDFAKSLVYDLMNNDEPSQPDNGITQPETNTSFTQTMSQETVNSAAYPDYSPSMQNTAVPTSSFATASSPTKEKPQSNINVQPAVFSNFQEVPVQVPETKNLNMLLDIPLQVTVELGRTSRTVKDILELGSGSIIELDKLAGEPVDILLNNQLIAQGEVVVIDENFGVRITEIVSQTDRIKKLK
ncbi:flagellar motor switch protein FliN [Heyndrickxia shackletonii]|uniref:Flagellar motor switch protein FliN n=1 Tax=Heyndrickxia shackletonii TaxID=157838 RepID=A0A0Q3TKW5_9BACI|nr:flagellar motor switch phosphatase FliY [Heyndrickxia shackletonii]KQL54624.1 flagellar motor switch protein FliN [Heyndrickxia shackletonii]MBB2478659.1 flagellar motor switch phosphatase FliY [Bacillus sp. APMAM]NEY98270.1 flagellar motor switch phosphatase FliY [Heyndrickxia shackletonii]RTZ57801.1 flagellar motor switch phosphatase FliY [Bacillus sp. SAJ1]